MSLPLSAELLPSRAYFLTKPDVSMLRPVLHATFYLRDGLAWANGHAADVLRLFLARFGRTAQLAAFRASTSDVFRAVDDSVLAELPAHLVASSVLARIRHRLRFELVDDRWAPSLGFDYREIDDSRSTQHGYLRIVVPPLVPSDEIFAFFLEIVQQYPVWAATAGFGCTFNELRPRNAFTVFHKWSRRWLGLGIQIPDVMTFHVDRGLPEIGWLTFACAEALASWDRWVPSPAPAPGVECVTLRHGSLIRAGESPELGDSNQLEYPHALARAWTVLQPLLVDPYPPLPGPFADEKILETWLARFSQPGVWE
ncbi:MAG: DUF3396 domain-containing protein [Sandaracinaceae bacterium]|nr:DUF3396 domain-containing protein [Sandaracinaceae bacterium]